MSTLIWLVVTAVSAAGTVVLGLHGLGRAVDTCREWRLDHRADRLDR